MVDNTIIARVVGFLPNEGEAVRIDSRQQPFEGVEHAQDNWTPSTVQDAFGKGYLMEHNISEDDLLEMSFWIEIQESDGSWCRYSPPFGCNRAFAHGRLAGVR